MGTTDILTLTNVFITAIYAFLTFLIMRANKGAVAAMRDQMAEQLRPSIQVSINLRVGTPIFQLSIKNVGRSPARNLQMNMDKDFYQFGSKSPDRNLAKHIAFTLPIDSLPPSSELIFDLGMAQDIFAENADSSAYPKTFIVTAKYQFGIINYSELTHIDLRPYIGSVIPRHPIAEELERMRKSIDDLRNVIKK